MSDANWLLECNQATHTSVKKAFGAIQQAMAAFDSYNPPDVKARHQAVFQEIKLVREELARVRLPGPEPR